MGERPLCKCHGEPMRRNGTQQKTGETAWLCTTKRRERARMDHARDPSRNHARSAAWYEANREVALKRKRDRYAADMVFRIETQLANRRRHALRMKRNRHQRLEGIRGEVQA